LITFLFVYQAEKEKNKPEQPVAAAAAAKSNKIAEEEISPNEYFKIRYEPFIKLQVPYLQRYRYPVNTVGEEITGNSQINEVKIRRDAGKEITLKG
jgi:hypothetical protein